MKQHIVAGQQADAQRAVQAHHHGRSCGGGNAVVAGNGQLVGAGQLAMADLAGHRPRCRALAPPGMRAQPGNLSAVYVAFMVCQGPRGISTSDTKITGERCGSSSLPSIVPAATGDQS